MKKINILMFIFIIGLIITFLTFKINKDKLTNDFIEKNKIQRVTPPAKGPALPGIDLDN